MATVAKSYEQNLNPIPEIKSRAKSREKWDTISKIAAVSLGFIVPTSTFLTHLSLSLLLIAWFLAGDLQKKSLYIFKHPLAQMVFLLFGMFALRSIQSTAPLSDITQSLWKMSKLLYIPFLLPLMTDRKWRRLAMGCFVAAMTLTLILGALKMFANIGFETRHTAACAFKNHIDTNFMMAFAAFLVGHWTLQSFLDAQKTKVQFFGIFLTILMCFYVLWMCEGRTGYIIFFALWVLFLLQSFAKKYFLLGVLLLTAVVIMVGVSSPAFQMRYHSAVSDIKGYAAKKDSSTAFGSRVEFVKETWYLAKEKFWIGYGTGSFKKIYGDHAKVNQLQKTTNPHNEYMNIMLQLGFCGLLIFLVFFAGAFKLSYALPRPDRYLAQGLILAMSIGCLANSWLMDVTSGYFFITMLAFCFGSYSNKKQDK